MSCRSTLNIINDGQNQPTVNLAANNANGVANGLNGAANGKQKYAFKDGQNDNFDVNPSSPDGTQGGIDSNPVCKNTGKYSNIILQTSGKGVGAFKYVVNGAATKTGQSNAELADAQASVGRSAFE